MAAAIDYQVWDEPHGAFVTCQRPIVLSVRVAAGAPAYFKGQLFIKDINNDWVNTRIIFNAYKSMNDSRIFEVNVMEYCRQYFTTGKGFYLNAYCHSNMLGYAQNGYNEGFMRKFKVIFFPVVYAAGASLQDEDTNTEETNNFVVAPINTRTWKGYSTRNDYIRIDKFVQGHGNGAVAFGGSSYCQMRTNMPQYNTLDIDTPNLWNTTVGLRRRGKSEHVVTTLEWGTTKGVMVGTVDIPLLVGQFLQTGYAEEMSTYFMNPGYMQMMSLFLDPTGFTPPAAANDFTVSKYAVLDTNSDLINEGSWYSVQQNFYSSGLGNILGYIQSYGVKRYVTLTSEKEGSSCSSKRTQFVFKNMYGGMDWFIATGTHESSVTKGGDTFSQMHNFDRYQDNFGVIPGKHAEKELWTSRVDEYTVTTQPLDEEYAEWLKELITSPEVYIVQEGIGMYGINPGATPTALDTHSQSKRLVPILISPGSYDIDTTEEHYSYLKFKYRLSEAITTQKN